MDMFYYFVHLLQTVKKSNNIMIDFANAERLQSVDMTRLEGFYDYIL